MVFGHWGGGEKKICKETTTTHPARKPTVPERPKVVLGRIITTSSFDPYSQGAMPFARGEQIPLERSLVYKE